jgi:hypothetical protein
LLAETLALVSAANAAFATVKKFTENGKEIADMAGALGKIMNAEEALKAQGKSKEKSIWRKAFGKSADGIDEFMQLEKIEQQKKEIKSIMQLYGRPGLYADWVNWQGKERVRKKHEAEEKEAARVAIINGLSWTVTGFLFVGLMYFLIQWAIENKGIFS